MKPRNSYSKYNLNKIDPENLNFYIENGHTNNFGQKLEKQNQYLKSSLQNFAQNLQQFTTKKEAEQIQQVLKQDVEDKMKEISLIKKKNSSSHKKIKREKKNEEQDSDNSSEESSDEDVRHVSFKANLKRKKKMKQNDEKKGSHICSNCFLIATVDAVKGMCKDCIIKERQILNLANQKNLKRTSNDHPKKTDKRLKKELFEKGYEKALKDVQNNKLTYLKNESESAEE